MNQKAIDYMRFMNNRFNEFKCDRCPANEGMESTSCNRCYPCGQQSCWVTVHCERHHWEEENM